MISQNIFQITLGLTFIIALGLITFYYTNNTNNTNTNYTKELFESTVVDDSPIPTIDDKNIMSPADQYEYDKQNREDIQAIQDRIKSQLVSNISSTNKADQPGISGKLDTNDTNDENNYNNIVIPGIDRTDIDINIKDLTIKKNVIQSLNNLNNVLYRYKDLDIPISINNNAVICSPWGTYNNSKYMANDNNCSIIPESSTTERQCLVSGTMTSCSKYYDNNIITTANTINTANIINNSKATIMSGVLNIMNDVQNKTEEMDKKLNDLISKRSLENQQINFIEYNTNSIDDKTKLVNKSSEEYNKTENNVNINQVQFARFLSLNNSTDKKNALYTKILWWLFGIIVFLGILNLLFTNLDEMNY